MSYQIHKFANLFPLMSSGEFTEFKAKIEQNGYDGDNHPIWLYDGKILDGRNRYNACQELNIEPTFKNYTGDDPIWFIIKENLERRHLTTDQKGKIGLSLLPYFEKQAKKREATHHAGDVYGVPKSAQGKGKSVEQAANAVFVGKTSLKQLKYIHENYPKLYRQIGTEIVNKKGKKKEFTLQDAMREIRTLKTKEKEQQAVQSLGETDKKLWTITKDQGIIACDALITDPPYGILNEKWEPADLENFTKDWAVRWNKCGADFVLIFWSQK